ncbi:YceI family protein [Shewanella waksmanii]|uniref:YceI family protein n=1 Tax=Shewanella waksmanii TaxID=213783 RepID=UPI003736B9FD
MKKSLYGMVAAATLMTSPALLAADYVIDTQGAHASIQFKVNHLGYSFVVGRFNEFEGKFSYDAKAIDASTFDVSINTASVDSNHAERDKHLRGADFLNTNKFPKATFKSTSAVDKGDGQFILNGELTLNGVTKPIAIDAKVVGEGQDPWGGYRAGFVGETEFALKDYDVKMDLGPASSHVQLSLVVEGIKQ